MENQLGALLIKKNKSICSAESFTVGAFGNLLGSCPGISKVYAGSLVCYQSRIKHQVLGVSQALIDQYGVISSEVCEAMAIQAQQLFQTQIAVSFTGNSGPSSMEGKPVGMCYVGIYLNEKVTVYPLMLKGKREEIKDQAVNFAVNQLIEEISKEEI